MAQDIEKLTLTLEANIKNFERDMDKARRSADKSLSDIERKAKESTAGVDGAMDRMGRSAGQTSAMFARFAGTIVGSLIGTGIIAGIAAVTSELTTLGEAARRADLSVANMQAIRDLAGLKDISQSKADSDITKMATKAYDEIKEGEGKLKELFEANNLKLTDREGKMKSINQLLIDAAGLVQNSNNAFDAAKVVEILGLSKDWVAVLREGPDAVRGVIAEGTAVNSQLAEMVRKAEAFDDAVKNAALSFSRNMKAAIYDVISALADMLAAIGNSISQMRVLSAEERQAAAARGDLIGAKFGYGRPPESGEEERPNFVPLTIGGKSKPKTGGTVIPKDKSGGGSSAAEKKNEYDREIQSIEKKTRALEGEAAAVGLTVFEGAKAEALAKLNLAAKQAEIELSPAQIAANMKIAESYAAISDKLKNLQLANQQWIELQNFAGQSMIDIFKGAASGAEGLRNAVKKLADSLLDATMQAMILGKGPLAGLFGTGNASNGGVGGLIGTLFSAFGGGGAVPERAYGGPVSGGRPVLVGERGQPELFVPNSSGNIFPIAQGGGGGGGGNNVTVQQSFVISGAFTKDDARAMAMQAATRAGQATRQSVLAELNSQRKRA